MGASFFIVHTVIAQHRGYHAATILSFVTAVALVLDEGKYRQFANRNPKLPLVVVLACLAVAAFMWEASVR